MKKLGMIIFAAVLPLAFAFSDEDGNKEAQTPEIKLNIELQKPGYGEGGGSGAAGLPHAGTLPAPEEVSISEKSAMYAPHLLELIQVFIPQPPLALRHKLTYGTK